MPEMTGRTHRSLSDFSDRRGYIYVESLLARPGIAGGQAHLFDEVGGGSGILIVNDEVVGGRELGSEVLGHWVA